MTISAAAKSLRRMKALEGPRKSYVENLESMQRVHLDSSRIYEAGGYQVLGAAPTGRAARELTDAADIRATTIHRLVSDLDGSDGLGRQTVILLDEAGTAPTRRSAVLFAQAERAGAKVVALGDSGQLPSVAAGGWFAAVTRCLNGPELRQVMRQRDPAERDALAALHDGDRKRTSLTNRLGRRSSSTSGRTTRSLSLSDRAAL